MKTGDTIKPKKDPLGGRGASWWEGELDDLGYNALPEDQKFGTAEKFDPELGMILTVYWHALGLRQHLAIFETEVDVIPKQPVPA